MNPTLTLVDDLEKSEQLRLDAAVAEALSDPRPSIPDQIIQEKLHQKMHDLKLRMNAAKTG
jgi:hypothetical protein